MRRFRFVRWIDRLTKWLFGDNTRVLLRAIDDCGRDEVAWPIRVGAAHCHLPVLLLDVCEETFYSLILHRVLDRSQEHVGIGAWSNLLTASASRS